MTLKTQGFLSLAQRNRHIQAHGADFPASDAASYEALADEFLSGPAGRDVHECTRSRGDFLRYDDRTEAFGAVDGAGIIRTFYKPVPCCKLTGVALIRIRQTGRCHPYSSNLEYFRSECKRW